MIFEVPLIGMVISSLMSVTSMVEAWTVTASAPFGMVISSFRTRFLPAISSLGTWVTS